LKEESASGVAETSLSANDSLAIKSKSHAIGAFDLNANTKGAVIAALILIVALIACLTYLAHRKAREPPSKPHDHRRLFESLEEHISHMRKTHKALKKLSNK
jgi:hypothetical protein